MEILQYGWSNVSAGGTRRGTLLLEAHSVLKNCALRQPVFRSACRIGLPHGLLSAVTVAVCSI